METPSRGQTAAKIVLGTAVAGGVAGALWYAFRRAGAAEGSAVAAGVRAARAEQLAIEAGKREKQAQGLVAWTQAGARQAGVAAQATVDAANRAIAQANVAVIAARSAALAAQNERNSNLRVALERDAVAKDAAAQQLLAQAETARQAAIAAEDESRRRIEADNQARASETDARKLREQAAAAAAADQQRADTRVLALECGRQAVAAGFRDLASEVSKRNPGYTSQQVTNATAGILRNGGLDLGTPNPAAPFWQQPCEVIRNKVQSTINVYLTAKRPAVKPSVAETPDPKPPIPTPQVSTVSYKQQWAQQAWAKAIEYAQRLSLKVGKPLDAGRAEALIRQTFQAASCSAPVVNCGVPVLSALSQPVAFWAQSDSDVQSALAHAYDAAVKFVNYQFLTLALDPKGNEVLVLPGEIQRSPDGTPLTKSVRVGGRQLPMPIAKTSARALDPNKALAGYSNFSSQDDVTFSSDNSAFRIV